MTDEPTAQPAPGRHRPNRFLALPRHKQALLAIGILVFLFIFLEIAIWGLAFIVDRTAGTNIVPEGMINNFHPLFNSIGGSGKYGPEDMYDPYSIYRPGPNLPIRPDERVDQYKWGTDRHGLVLNSTADALRDLERDPKATCRVFVLGGSTVMGSGSGTNLAAFMESRLNEKGPRRFEVINAGWSGYASAQEVTRTATRLVYYQPDIIVTFDGINDALQSTLLKTYERNDHVRAQELESVIDSEPRIPRRSTGMQSAANFFGKFYTIRLAARPFEAGLDKRWPTDATHRSHYLADLYNYSRPVFRDVGLSAYIENLRSISGIARVRNAATVHILQPTLATELVRRGAGVTRDERAIMTRPVPLGQLDAEALTLVFNQFMEEARTAFLAQASRDPLDVWLDYTDFFASVPDLTTVYYDRVHYLDARTEEIANRIAQDLAPVLSAGACRER